MNQEELIRTLETLYLAYLNDGKSNADSKYLRKNCDKIIELIQETLPVSNHSLVQVYNKDTDEVIGTPVQFSTYKILLRKGFYTGVYHGIRTPSGEVVQFP